jgi:hypothetical protein
MGIPPATFSSYSLSLEGEGQGEGGPCQRAPPHLTSSPLEESKIVLEKVTKIEF